MSLEFAILTIKIKLIKPNPAVFKKVINKYKFEPEETLFIDDLYDNCKSAESVGIKTIQFKSYSFFIQQFKKLIPRC